MSERRRLLGTDSIIASAEIASGTNKLVDDGLYARVDALADWFRTGAPMTEHQALYTRRQIVQILTRRLSIERDLQKWPEILDEEIKDPIFVVGFARTGTSLMQSLLSADPAHRTPTAWRTREPSPPPGLIDVTAFRRARAEADVMRFVDRCPGLLALHPYWDEGADCAIEDEEIFTLDFLNAYPSLLYEASSLAIMVSISDGEGAYGFLKRFMQHQQWRCPKKRWVMKGVEHQRQLQALFQVFPDAHCIWAHREPADFLPSIFAISAIVYDGITGGAAERSAIAAGFYDSFRSEIHRIVSDPLIDDPRIFHAPFKSLTQDPVSVLRSAYENWNFALTDDAALAMRAWLDDGKNRGDRYGKLPYAFEPYGVDWEEESKHFDQYRARFLSN